MLCYCGSTYTFEVCCQHYIAGQNMVEHCEQLMRSRYSAYCSGNISYIFDTYHSSVQTSNPMSVIKTFSDSVHFIKLNILASEQTANEGYVDFSVTYIQHNLKHEFSERSRFTFDQRWLYIDGVLTDTPVIKIGRNDMCPCNSGKKFKQCLSHRLSGN